MRDGFHVEVEGVERYITVTGTLWRQGPVADYDAALGVLMVAA